MWLRRLLARAMRGREYHLKEILVLLRSWANRHPGQASLVKQYEIALPEGFGQKRVVVRLTVPELPASHIYSFGEHVLDSAGNATDRVLAVRRGGLAISDDLGLSWRDLPIRNHAYSPVFNVKAL